MLSLGVISILLASCSNVVAMRIPEIRAAL